MKNELPHWYCVAKWKLENCGFNGKFYAQSYPQIIFQKSAVKYVLEINAGSIKKSGFIFRLHLDNFYCGVIWEINTGSAHHCKTGGEVIHKPGG